MSLLYPLIQALVLFAVAPLLSGVTAWRARLHNRRGPGVLQEYRDIIKLLGRQSIAPADSSWVFRLTPFVMVGVMLTIATALPVVTVGSPLPQLGDLITCSPLPVSSSLSRDWIPVARLPPLVPAAKRCSACWLNLSCCWGCG
jgi:formate hydrogenlyase subunit 4